MKEHNNTFNPIYYIDFVYYVYIYTPISINFSYRVCDTYISNTMVFFSFSDSSRDTEHVLSEHCATRCADFAYHTHTHTCDQHLTFVATTATMQKRKCLLRIYFQPTCDFCAKLCAAVLAGVNGFFSLENESALQTNITHTHTIWHKFQANSIDDIQNCVCLQLVPFYQL